jgi:hypothetical protein
VFVPSVTDLNVVPAGKVLDDRRSVSLPVALVVAVYVSWLPAWTGFGEAIAFGFTPHAAAKISGANSTATIIAVAATAMSQKNVFRATMATSETHYSPDIKMTAPTDSTLVLLSLDEREALLHLLPLVPRSLFAKVIAIDGGSTDGTREVYLAHDIPVHVQATRGRGRAFQLAAELVDTEFVAFLSTDGNEDPGDLPWLLRELRGGADLVIAGRFRHPSSASDDSDDPFRLRRAGATAFGFIVDRLWRTGVHDATNGYRAFRVDALRRLRLDAPHNEIELQSTIRAAKLGMRIVERPTCERPRLAGRRKASAGTLTLGLRAALLILRELVSNTRFVRPAPLEVSRQRRRA